MLTDARFPHGRSRLGLATHESVEVGPQRLGNPPRAITVRMDPVGAIHGAVERDALEQERHERDVRIVGDVGESI